MDSYKIIYIILAIILWILGYIHTGRLIRPKWKIAGKFIFYIGVSILLIFWIGPYSLIFIIGHPLTGLIFHTIICRRYNINWFTCEPESRYIELQDKWAKGNFN